MRAEAEEYIKDLFYEHDHDPLHARAVTMFLRGVDWVLDQHRTKQNKFENSKQQQGEENEVRG